MKIGFEAKRVFYNSTGLGNYSRDLISSLLKFHPKNEYHLFSPGIGNKGLFTDKIDRVKLHFPKGIYSTFKSYWRRFKVGKEVKNLGLDIFHGLSAELPNGIEKSNAKSIVTVHDLIFLRYPELYPLIDRNIYRIKVKNACVKADLVIAISEQTKQDIVEFLNISPSKIRIVYQSCNDIFKKPLEEKIITACKKKYGLPEKYILNVGTVETRKNQLSIIKAIADTDINLVIVGRKTKYHEEIDKYILSKGMKDRVFFVHGTSQEELASIYQAAFVFCYPSLFEGFGIPILEALYSKIPVITSKGSCFKEVGGPKSIYVDSKNVEELKNQILRIMDDKKLRDDMKASGLEYSKKFDSEVLTSQIMDIYQEI